MAVQIIPRTGGAAGFGGDLGSAIGSGLSSGLQQLAHNKMEQLQKRHGAQKLKRAFPELPEDAIGWINDLEPKQQIEVLQSIAQHQQESIKQQEQPITLESITPDQKQQMRDYLKSPESQGVHSPEELQKLAKFLEQPEEPIKQNGLKGLQQQLGGNPVGTNPFPKVAEAQVAPQQQVQPTQQKKSGIPLETFATKKSGSASSGEPSAKVEEALRKEAHEEKIRAHKESQVYEDEVRSAVEAKDKIVKKLKQYKEILEKGKHSNPGTVATVNAVKAHGWGPDIGPSTLTSDTQKLNKIASSFIKDAISLGGSKATNFMEQKFLESYPNPAQPKDVQLANIDLVLQEFEGLQERYDALKDIKKTNGGYRPLDVAAQVDDVLSRVDSKKK